jgi:hypothetical protein
MAEVRMDTLFAKDYDEHWGFQERIKSPGKNCPAPSVSRDLIRYT